MANPRGEYIDHTPVSLQGEEGEQVAHNVRQIALGRMMVKEAGPAFGLTRGGTLSIEVDTPTMEALEKIGMSPHSDEQAE